MAQSGHAVCSAERPLLGVKRTSKFKSVTSAFDPTATSAAQDLRSIVRLDILRCIAWA
jgi:hypothetical protein